MTPPARAGLSTAQLDDIRAALNVGRKPKVVFTAAAGQIAGQAGQVVELTDPALSDEWVVVHFGRDQLPFSPADLAIPVRGQIHNAKPARKVATAAVDEPPPGPGLLENVRSSRPVSKPREEHKMTPGKSAARPTPASVEPKTNGHAPAAAVLKKVVRPGKSRLVPAVTITLAYADGEWTVGAQHGSKALAKPYAIKPAEAMKIVALLDVPGVNEVVQQILAADRAQAESQAEKLRAELAEIEARLAELRGAR
jgi:hypothetical protein